MSWATDRSAIARAQARWHREPEPDPDLEQHPPVAAESAAVMMAGMTVLTVALAAGAVAVCALLDMLVDAWFG